MGSSARARQQKSDQLPFPDANSVKGIIDVLRQLRDSGALNSNSSVEQVLAMFPQCLASDYRRLGLADDNDWQSLEDFLHLDNLSHTPPEMEDLIEKELEKPYDRDNIVFQLRRLAKYLGKTSYNDKRQKSVLLKRIPQNQRRLYTDLFRQRTPFDVFIKLLVERIESNREIQPKSTAERSVGSGSAAGSSSMDKTQISELIKKVDTLANEIEEMKVVLQQAPKAQRIAHCLYCRRSGHYRTTCHFLREDLDERRVVLVNNRICWPNGNEVPFQKSKGGMMKLIRDQSQSIDKIASAYMDSINQILPKKGKMSEAEFQKLVKEAELDVKLKDFLIMPSHVRKVLLNIMTSIEEKEKQQSDEDVLIARVGYLKVSH
ncbi:hypothetical protein LPJ78_003434 [Coemansia sp. RSA 989]|nr:hypothetical protein LPJ68_003567 [Coemansia sp. RSA 1086]KAJ1864342.1 hypothetical protein LPJ78_003434 [Coemansia sp. RSA 989]KAJ2670739.1 hypothetical protein IWW42_003772 [Coemansia sp. RSA 1085]